MTAYPILTIFLIILIIAALPTWPYSRRWGYYPSGGLRVVLFFTSDHIIV